MLFHILLAAATLAASALAEYPSAQIAVDSNNHNTTITVQLNSIYKNSNLLQDVSALYLTGAIGAQKDQISCTPFFSSQGAGKHAAIFSSNTVSYPAADSRSNGGRIGSIVCISSGVSQGPGLGNPGSASSTAGAQHKTSTTLVTHTPRPQTLSGSGYRSKSAAGPTAATASASSSASQSAGNAASAIYLSGEFFGGLAIAGFGVAFAL